ncbi:MAG: toxic anion resistance protein [Lachnospiraceae bacterium]|nr:toxic anion resistance protein [Lachnospiraceae bacterium]
MDENKEIGYLRVIAGNPGLGLDVADIPQIETSVAELDCSDITSITRYGLDTQKKMAELSQVMINNLNNSTIDEVDDTLRDTIRYLCDIDDDDDNDRKLAFWRKKNNAVAVRKKYDQAAKNVDNIAVTLEEHQVRLIRDCAFLNQMFEMNREYHRQAGVKIAALKMKAEEIRAKLSQSDGSPMEESWMNNIIDRLERKAVELELSRTVAVQQAAQIRMLQTNFAMMADKLQSTLYNTIPLWKNQIVLALGAEHARQAIRTDQSISDMTNRLLIKNAENLKIVTEESQRASGSTVVEPRTLAETNRILIESLNEVARIQSENRTKRESAERELARIDHEMQYGITSND